MICYILTLLFKKKTWKGEGQLYYVNFCVCVPIENASVWYQFTPVDHQFGHDIEQREKFETYYSTKDGWTGAKQTTITTITWFPTTRATRHILLLTLYLIICANYSVVLYVVGIRSSAYIGFTWLPILYRVVSPAPWKVHDLFQCHWCEPDWYHDGVIKWKPFPRYNWPSVSEIHRWLVDHKGKWRGAFMFYLICAWTNGWANNRNACDLRRHRAHYDVNIMMCKTDLS